MRVKRGTVSKRRHKRLLKQAEGYRGRRNTAYKVAKLAVQKGLTHAYKDRRRKKRDFRTLWIARINAAVRIAGLSYSKFILGCQKAQIGVDRKIMAHLATNDPAAFAVIAEKAKAAL